MCGFYENRILTFLYSYLQGSLNHPCEYLGAAVYRNMTMVWQAAGLMKNVLLPPFFFKVLIKGVIFVGVALAQRSWWLWASQPCLGSQFIVFPQSSELQENWSHSVPGHQNKWIRRNPNSFQPISGKRAWSALASGPRAIAITRQVTSVQRMHPGVQKWQLEVDHKVP